MNISRRAFLVTAIAILVLFASCSPKASPNSLPGTWVGTWGGEADSMVLEFKADGSWSALVKVNGAWVKPSGYNFNYANPKYKVEGTKLSLYDGENFSRGLGLKIEGDSVSFDQDPFKDGSPFKKGPVPMQGSAAAEDEGPGGQK